MQAAVTCANPIPYPLMRIAFFCARFCRYREHQNGEEPIFMHPLFVVILPHFLLVTDHQTRRL
jgi:hypothetical protein